MIISAHVRQPDGTPLLKLGAVNSDEVQTLKELEAQLKAAHMTAIGLGAELPEQLCEHVEGLDERTCLVIKLCQPLVKSLTPLDF